MVATFESTARNRMAALAGSVGRAFLDLLYPPLCLVCRAAISEPRALCPTCWAKITFFEDPMCTCCGLPFEIDPGADSLCASCLAVPPAFDCARAAMAYDDTSKGAVLAFKRSDRLEFAHLFALWLKRAGQPLLEQADLIVPVPLHRRRLWARRYNQSSLLAQRLSHLSGKPFDSFALTRVRPTASQGAMPSAKARARNMRGAFHVLPAQKMKISKRRVLLVDDVLTTGATIDACARALKRAGAEKVLVLTVARVPRPLPRVI